MRNIELPIIGTSTHWPIQLPLHDIEGAEGEPAGGAGAGAGDAAAAAAAAAKPITLSDDTLITGADGKPVKYGDYRKGFTPNADVDKLRTNTRDLVLKLIRQQAGQKPQGQQPHQPDPLAKFREAPVVSGEMLGELIDLVQKDGFGSRDKIIRDLQAKIATLEKGVGSSAERDAVAQHNALIDSALAKLELPAPMEKLSEEARTALRELALGVYWKHDDRDPETAAKLPELVASEFSRLRKIVTELDKLDLAAAHERNRQRLFERPGADSSANGKGRKAPPSNRDLAKRFFAVKRGDAASATI